jgi:hypothetical protein
MSTVFESRYSTLWHLYGLGCDSSLALATESTENEILIEHHYFQKEEYSSTIYYASKI